MDEVCACPVGNKENNNFLVSNIFIFVMCHKPIAPPQMSPACDCGLFASVNPSVLLFHMFVKYLSFSYNILVVTFRATWMDIYIYIPSEGSPLRTLHLITSLAI